MLKAKSLIKKFSNKEPAKTALMKDGVQGLLSHYKDAAHVVLQLQQALKYALEECREYFIVRVGRLRSELKQEYRIKRSIKLLTSLLQTVEKCVGDQTFTDAIIKKYFNMQESKSPNIEEKLAKFKSQDSDSASGGRRHLSSLLIE
jgi:hypothetical protein